MAAGRLSVDKEVGVPDVQAVDWNVVVLSRVEAMNRRRQRCDSRVSRWADEAQRGPNSTLVALRRGKSRRILFARASTCFNTRRIRSLVPGIVGWRYFARLIDLIIIPDQVRPTPVDQSRPFNRHVTASTQSLAAQVASLWPPSHVEIRVGNGIAPAIFHLLRSLRNRTNWLAPGDISVIFRGSCRRGHSLWSGFLHHFADIAHNSYDFAFVRAEKPGWQTRWRRGWDSNPR